MPPDLSRHSRARLGRLASVLAAGLATAALASRAAAQEGGRRPVSRREAVAAALANGARLAIARADTSAARAELLTARAIENPLLSTSYSRSAPQYHVGLDQPFDYPGVRHLRIAAADWRRRAALFLFQAERVSAEIEADTTYTAALAAFAHARLSSENAIEADSLLTLARVRQSAGDASQLDVELAAISAGQAENAAVDDSLTALTALLELQRLMGIAAERPTITPSDSLLPIDADSSLSPGAGRDAGSAPRAGAALASGASGGTARPGAGAAPAAEERVLVPVAAARATVRGAEQAVMLERRGILGTPSLQLGFENHDPSGSEPGILPTVGISLPLPLWNHRGGEVALATANLQRARAELALAERQGEANRARAIRARDLAAARASRDQRLLASARRVAAMSLTAYAEGAEGLPAVLEAQRNAREALGRYIDDLAAASIAAATLRLYSLTVPAP